MHKTAQDLIQKINDLTQNKPIIYFARDAERALGLENRLKNYYIVCIEKSYITEQLSQLYPDKIFCAEAEGLKLQNNSTLDLINSPQVIAWLKNITKGKEFYAQLFQFNHPAYLKLQKLGATILNNDAKLNRLFEDKLSQLRFLEENKIPIPKSKILEISSQSYSELSNEFGARFVMQLDRAHTGLGTFIIENEKDFEDFIANYGGNSMRISEFIDGQPYTLNGCITSKSIYVKGLQYQITGYKELTPGRGSTVGNDWSFANQLEQSLKDKIFNVVSTIGAGMQKQNYRGIFGVDLIIRENEVFVIEINARQTANISLQTKLEINQNQVPLLLLHLAEFLKLEIPAEIEPGIQNLEGSQVFLRAKVDNFKIENHLSSGIYRLQSDNSAQDWSWNKLRIMFKGFKPKLIFIDEDKDKPLVWQKDGYSIDQIGQGGFVLLLPNTESTRNKFEEVARMQFTNQIVYNNQVSPWVIEALVNIEKQITKL